MKIMICDDESCYSDALVSYINTWGLERQHLNISTNIFRSSEDALEKARSSSIYDVAFLDVRFSGELDGISMAKELRMLNDKMVIVFISNYDQYAVDGYTVEASRFLTKPVTQSKVFECLDIAYQKYVTASTDPYIIVEGKGQVCKLSVRSICYIESRGHFVNIHTTNLQNETIHMRCRLRDIYKQLPDNLFMQCHQSYIINMTLIYKITKTFVTLTDGSDIPISYKYRKELLSGFNMLYQE